MYNGSPIKIVMDNFPSHHWVEWKFEQVPKGFWSGRDNQQRYWTWVCHELELPIPEGLYDISKAIVRRLNGSFKVLHPALPVLFAYAAQVGACLISTTTQLPLLLWRASQITRG